MATATAPLPTTSTLTPTNNSEPVLQALVQSIATGHPPETWLRIAFHKPCGGVSIRYAWTAGGDELGDHIDLLAQSTGFDAADWMHITNEHAQISIRGRIETQAHLLRPILRDIEAGTHCPQDFRDGLHRLLDCAAEQTGQPRRPGWPRWVGVGPTLLARRTA
ncbi:hypothetical protein ACFUS2_00740 [[Kitasatospora] papulosa]|uniref:hypothetical protein n=1 Tax=[Kitasatospora] papulosa TaxID=1464011 RepID=UPI003633CE31